VNAEGGDGGAVHRLDDANALAVGGGPDEQAVHFGNNFLDENLKQKCKNKLFKQDYLTGFLQNNLKLFRPG
jgi:hypothetical protein